LRLLIQHRSRYCYDEPANLGAHLVRLRPAPHCKARVEAYSLFVEQPCVKRWQHDAYGNHVLRLLFEEPVSSLDLLVELRVDIQPVNPFDFFLDERCEAFPFEYPRELFHELEPFLDTSDPALAAGPLFEAFDAELPREGHSVTTLVELNRLVNQRIRYVIREEPGIWTPEETLENGRGSCRDSAALLMLILRRRGYAARFVSGYLVQLTDEGMIPDEPKGVSRDVVDLHAWVEVYLPGGGWVGLDATSGLFCGEGHIPLCCSTIPSLASPIDGTTDQPASDVSFSMAIARLGHEPRPTTPYEEPVWNAVLAAGERTDERLARLGITLTMGGEPTFNSRLHPDAPEWNSDALGPTKRAQGKLLAEELCARLTPGGLLLHRMGKIYPGETLPRWALEVMGRRDGERIWSDGVGLSMQATVAAAQRFADALAQALGLSSGMIAGYEDPWPVIFAEQRLPPDADPLAARLEDPEERRRLARILDRGVSTAVGWALPLAKVAGVWRTSAWTFRRGRMFLIPGDSPMGLRLPLDSLGSAQPYYVQPYEPTLAVPDPRHQTDEPEDSAARPVTWNPDTLVRTALCVEARDGELFVFLPPVHDVHEFLELVGIIDRVRGETGLNVILEGYPPPRSPILKQLTVTPDPGVLEVNLPPVASAAEYSALVDTVFDAALHTGLHSEKYLIDGRMAGSGGGNHLTLGGETPLESPFVRRPDVLASLITFLQHHPALSFLFTGLFVGPTSQAPRVDEARHDSLPELEIALARAFEVGAAGKAEPWLSDHLFRNLLVDLAGNTHRAELCIDKLFDPRSPHGRQGVIELRAFEMPPHPRMVTAQMMLVRSLVTAFAEEPYSGRLVRWGQRLHDQMLLPHWLWADMLDVLAFLHARGLPLPEDAYRPFLELRCPVVGRVEREGIVLEVRNALEPWPVLGEEMMGSGTARYVDSSMERVQVRVENFIPERHVVLVNGQQLPLQPTGTAGELVGGVRFRAWAPPQSLHAHIGIHHPIRVDVLDTWGRRSVASCSYHVWHPEGRAFLTPPLTRFEAAARRSQRFVVEGPLLTPVSGVSVERHPDAPFTLDLRRLPIDRPMPRVEGDKQVKHRAA
jgi:uncharacterized protein (DUF2126 family)